MMGLSLRNVRLKVIKREGGAVVFEDFGELLFTHFGITGPLVLSASAHIPDIEAGKYEIVIDLKPALDEKTLDARIISDFQKYSNRDFINALSDLLPQKAIEPVAAMTGIPFHKKVNAITREERQRLSEVLHGIRLNPVRFRPIAEAIVTKGGVNVKEVNPKTMESKLTAGLYFAGEILDLDAYTGGFNLQIAFSTARAAGLAIAKEIKGY
jgi:predicted Rossmann fold flavoprotein